MLPSTFRTAAQPLLAAALVGLAVSPASAQFDPRVPPEIPATVPLPQIPTLGRVDRSIMQPEHHPVDELDRPQWTRRKNHRGWEQRTSHFVVFSTISAEQARWTANELETCWNDIAHLADAFTNVHRQPTFALCEVSVLIYEETRQAPSVIGPRPLNDDANLYVSLAADSPPLEAQLPRLRAESWRSFLRVTGFDQRLPDWVQEGFASYFADEPLPPPAILAEPDSELAIFEPITTTRAAFDRMVPRDDRQAQLGVAWVRYLLESDDAQHVPLLLETIRVALDPHEPAPPERLPGADRSRGTWRPPIAVVTDEIWDVARLASLDGDKVPDAPQRLEHWLRDPAEKQPLVDLGDLAENPAVANAALEMALVLKLARRFQEAAAPEVQTKIIEWRRGAAAASESRPNFAQQPLDLDALHARLIDEREPAWATLDIDGQPLVWYDRGRLEQLFDPPAESLSSSRLDGRDVLERRLANGLALEAWLEENPKEPARPIIRVRRAGEPFAPPAEVAAPPSDR
ncbi:MAG: hypothetical protein K2Y37_05130 [Pirellulales bacterium]|nr:hypothetical protein [Pirellulales bacterium]